MRASILPEDDIAWNLNFVVSRRRVKPGFRDVEYIVVIVSNLFAAQLAQTNTMHAGDV